MLNSQVPAYFNNIANNAYTIFFSTLKNTKYVKILSNLHDGYERKK